MINTEYPVRKNFEQDFLTEDGEMLFTLRYQQATMEEYHEFFAKSETERAKELYDLIKPQFPLSKQERIFAKIFPNFRGKIERSLDMEILLKNVLNNRFRTYKSIYEGLENKNASPWSNLGIFSANLSIICQKYCISPDNLFKNFTLEQFMWMMDGIIFQANMMDSDGKFMNQQALIDKDEVKARAAETRRAFEEYEKSLIK